MGKWSDMARELEAGRAAPQIPEAVPIVPIVPIGQPEACGQVENAPIAIANGTIGTNGTESGDGCSSLPQWWAARVAAMPEEAPPGVSARWWFGVREASTRFLSEWGEIAHAFGWTSADLFAVDAKRPHERIDQYGLCPLLAGSSRPRVVALTEAGATIQGARSRTSFRRRDREPPGIVLVWTLAADN